MLTPMEKLTPLTPLTPLGAAVGEGRAKETASREGEGVFGAIFRSAIENVKETDAEAKEAQYLLATGQLDNPAMAMIAGTKSAVAVDFLIQLRNKAQDAYSELTRMNF
ncbi:MAG: flagellar hook-basal body complex protein FliE [Oscillibacter sp.]|jgi:flagellar hook-basal body complex protein FliE|nr:flagellar hook-basal body complex protein FliE [uncultured Oscillibacter sp.]MCI8971147.1 flagellar hook-basal body complex protein FliE [Oscillibacter sp.]